MASRGVIEHRNDSDYGENIFCSWSSNVAHSVAGSEPVHHWYNEIKDHKFGKEPTSLKTGHFTQVRTVREVDGTTEQAGSGSGSG